MNDQVASPHAAAWPVGVPQALPVPDESLWQGYARRAQASPDIVALDFLGRQYTWAELVEASLRLAAGLQQAGVGAGDRVVLFMQNTPQYIIGFHAILRLGAVVVPLNPMYKAAELVHYLDDAEPVAALASSDIAHELAQAAAQQLAPAPLQHLVVFHLWQALPEAAAAVARQQQWPPAWQDWLLAQHPLPVSGSLQVHEWQGFSALPPLPLAWQAPGDALAVLPYTSGTTGLPKGCMHSHATLLHNALSARPWLDQNPGDVVLIVVPMFHVTGLVMGMLAAVQHACRMALLPRWDARQAARVIAEQGVTHWPNIPTMVIDLLAQPDVESLKLDSLRYIGGGGAPMPAAVAARLQARCRLHYVEGYGLTETAAPSHTNPRHAPRLGSMGIPYVSTEAYVIDIETLQPLPAGQTGEVVVAGPQVFLGYWRQPQATEQAFITLHGKRFFRTGDLGRTDDDGYFHLSDRLKRMINASGFKVWPAEVESQLHRHPAVQQACVIARRDPYRGETVKAVVVLNDDWRGRITPEALMQWARQEMAAYKYPRIIEFADSLPRSATGKVMWRELQAQEDANKNPVAG